MLQSQKALPLQRNTCVSTAWFAAVLVVFIAATRWPLAPRDLYYFDSANFALSLEDFNPALHQPQPPGYPLFVLLIRTIHLFVPAAEKVLLIAGLLAAFAAVALIFFLAAELFGRNAGILAAALLASDPAFWFGGITNQVRLFLAVGALAVSLLAWRALTRPGDPRCLYAAFAALGISAGFRPELALLLLPVLAWVWWSTGRSPRRLSLALASLGACILPWLAVTAWVVGGPLNLLSICADYTDSQFTGSSLLYGAATHAAWHMFACAAVWTSLGALAWFWAVPLAWRRIPARAAAFLAIAFLPCFLFSATVHIGDPDQALAGVSLLTVFGAGVLAAVISLWRIEAVYSAAAAVLLVHAFIFFFPPGRLARACSYKAVAAVDRMNRAAFDSVRALAANGPVTIVHYGSPVASRQLSYYFPNAYVIVLPPSAHGAGEGAEVFYRHSTFSSPHGATVAIPPGGTTLLCFRTTPPRNGAQWLKRGPLYYRKWGHEPVSIGAYTLIENRTVTAVANPPS